MMAGGKGQGPGKRQANAVGSLPSCWKDRQEEGGVFLWGRHSLSFRSFNPHPEPRVDSVVTMATDGEREAGRTEVVLPQVTWLVSVRAGIPASVCPQTCPSFGSLRQAGPLWAGNRASDGGWVPGQACASSSLSISAVPASPSAPQEGLAPGSWPGPDQRACSARPVLHFASPRPAHPASAASSLLLIWFLSRMITLSNNKTRVHFLTADCSHALIQRYRSPRPVLAWGHLHAAPRPPPCPPWLSVGTSITPVPCRFPGEQMLYEYLKAASFLPKGPKRGAGEGSRPTCGATVGPSLQVTASDSDR